MSEMNRTMEDGLSDSESDTSLRQKYTGLVINGLHLRSPPGACVLLAGVLLLVGTGVAVAGYWPHHPRKTTPHHAPSGRTPSEKLKLVGPIIMGFGLFIFICASTLLYENRDHRLKQNRTLERCKNSKQCSQPKTNPDTPISTLSSFSIESLQDGNAVPALNCSRPTSQVNFDPSDSRDHVRLTFTVIKINNCLLNCPDSNVQECLLVQGGRGQSKNVKDSANTEFRYYQEKVGQR